MMAPRILPILNSGGPGHDWTRANYDYEWLFHGMNRRAPKNPTPREYADKYGGFVLQLPGIGHIGFPMQFRCAGLMTELAAREPDNADHQARADWALFAEAGKRFAFWKGFYVGGPQTLPAQDYETAEHWRDRAFQELLPLLRAEPDAIFFDAAHGRAIDGIIYGRDRGLHQLVDRIERMGIAVGFEPTLSMHAGYLTGRSGGVYIQDNFWKGMESAGDGNTWDTGKNANDPWYRPGTLHEPVFMKLNPVSEPWDEIAWCHGLGENFVACVNIGKLPFIQVIEGSEGAK